MLIKFIKQLKKDQVEEVHENYWYDDEVEELLDKAIKLQGDNRKKIVDVIIAMLVDKVLKKVKKTKDKLYEHTADISNDVKLMTKSLEDVPYYLKIVMEDDLESKPDYTLRRLDRIEDKIDFEKLKESVRYVREFNYIDVNSSLGINLNAIYSSNLDISKIKDLLAAAEMKNIDPVEDTGVCANVVSTPKVDSTSVCTVDKYDMTGISTIDLDNLNTITSEYITNLTDNIDIILDFKQTVLKNIDNDDISELDIMVNKFIIYRTFNIINKLRYSLSYIAVVITIYKEG